MAIFFISFFQHLLSFLLFYKYWGLFFVAFLSSLFLPIPASTTLAAAGGFASQGYLNIYAVLVVSVFGSIIGDVSGYLLARHYGERILTKFIFFRHIINSGVYKKVENYIIDFAPSLIFFSRFLTSVCSATNILAGLSKVSYKSFLTFALFGEIVYTVLYGVTGFLLGSQWQNNISFIFKAGIIMLSLGVAVNLIQILLYRRKRKIFNKKKQFS